MKKHIAWNSWKELAEFAYQKALEANQQNKTCKQIESDFESLYESSPMSITCSLMTQLYLQYLRKEITLEDSRERSKRMQRDIELGLLMKDKPRFITMLAIDTAKAQHIASGDVIFVCPYCGRNASANIILTDKKGKSVTVHANCPSKCFSI